MARPKASGNSESGKEKQKLILSGAVGYDTVREKQYRYSSTLQGNIDGSDGSFTFLARGKKPNSTLQLFADGIIIDAEGALLIAERLLFFARTGSIGQDEYG